MNRGKLKNEKAITLIALVVTIVVLIILAGVTINLTLSQNGIINKAKEARDLYPNAQEEEKEQIEKAIEDIEEITNLDTLETGTSWNFSTVGDNEFMCENKGVYLLELYGAQGGANGGKGTYTKAYVFLNKGDSLKITIGGCDGTNGGGDAYSDGNNGGGATSAYIGDTELLTAGGGAGYSYTTKRTWESNYNSIRNYTSTSNDTGNVTTEVVLETPTSNGELKNGTKGTSSDTGNVVTGSTSKNITEPSYDGYGNVTGTLYGKYTTTYYSRTVEVNGGGGGGHFGGVAGSCGTSFINTSKCFNYDINTYKKSNIEYTGTNGENDFESANINYNVRSNDGEAKITYLAARVDE